MKNGLSETLCKEGKGGKYIAPPEGLQELVAAPRRGVGIMAHNGRGQPARHHYSLAIQVEYETLCDSS